MLVLFCIKEVDVGYDILLPTEESFEAFIRPADSVNFVLFSAPWCPYCQVLKPIWSKVASLPPEHAFLSEVRVQMFS